MGRELRARNLSSRTVQSHLEAARIFGEYLAAQGMPTDVANVHREHVESFMEHLLGTFRPTTTAFRYASLRVLVQLPRG